MGRGGPLLAALSQGVGADSAKPAEAGAPGRERLLTEPEIPEAKGSTDHADSDERPFSLPFCRVIF